MSANLPKNSARRVNNRRVCLAVLLALMTGCGVSPSAGNSPAGSDAPPAGDTVPVRAAPPARLIDGKRLDADPDRAIAHWLIEMGGGVSIDDGENTNVKVRVVADIPKKKFKIQQLDFRDTDVTDVEFKQLAGKKVALGKLTSIMLNGTKVTDDGLAAVEKFNNTLNDLCVQDLKGVTKKSASVIAKLTNLTNLEVEGSGLDNVEALKGLSGLKNLKRLDVNKDAIGKGGVDQLRKLFPKADIE